MIQEEDNDGKEDEVHHENERECTAHIRFITDVGQMTKVQELAAVAEIASSEEPTNRQQVDRTTSDEKQYAKWKEGVDLESEQDQKDHDDAETQRTKSDFNFRENV